MQIRKIYPFNDRRSIVLFALGWHFCIGGGYAHCADQIGTGNRSGQTLGKQEIKHELWTDNSLEVTALGGTSREVSGGLALVTMAIISLGLFSTFRRGRQQRLLEKSESHGGCK